MATENQGVIINAEIGKHRINLYEFNGPGADPSKVLYDPSGVIIHYGFDGNVVYGDQEGYAYSGLEKSPGLHSIYLSRKLFEGENITLTWKNGYQLLIYVEDGVTKVKKRSGGSYQEIGQWADGNGHSEKTALKFNDDVTLKRFEKIETKSFEEI